MYFGAAWYPEHWPESRWLEDVRLMREAGMNVCRIGEFAWSRMEPAESQYELDWLDRAIGLLHAEGLAVVLGTPTAAPPAWLTHHHPDTLAIEQSGRPAQHGNRCHASPNSHTYLRYCRRIAEQMAKRFGQDRRVIGWQIDNEYNRVDYSDEARRQFHNFLKTRYTTLEKLNDYWSADYWSQTYHAWDEIPLPIGAHNPGLMLDFRHFVTQTWREFQAVQIEAIRAHSLSEQWITHNFMGWFDAFDHYALTADLDFAAWDWYIGTGHHTFPACGAPHDLTRGLKRKNFWIMETQPGTVNWSGINNFLNRGEARVMAFHGAAHGADALLYWQWRPAPGGQEQLHGSCLGADGNPRPFFAEVTQIGVDFARAARAIQGTMVVNEVALLHSYDARWSVNWQRHHKDFDPVHYLQSFYSPLAKRNVGVDIVSSEVDLSGYKLVIAPALALFTEASVVAMTAYVRGGGTLVLTVRCGQKDAHNALFPTLQPGPLRELAGVEVADYYALDVAAPVQAEWGDKREGEAKTWAELLRPLTSEVEVIARHGASNGWLDDTPAVTLHAVGSGKVVYVGAWLDEVTQDSLIERLLAQAGVDARLAGASEGVEVSRRVHPDGRTVWFVINHTREGRTLALDLPLPASVTDLLTGEEFASKVPLPAYGVRLFATG